jgi:hypothetical protein
MNTLGSVCSSGLRSVPATRYEVSARNAVNGPRGVPMRSA